MHSRNITKPICAGAAYARRTISTNEAQNYAQHTAGHTRETGSCKRPQNVIKYMQKKGAAYK